MDVALTIAYRFALSRRRSMAMSLFGVVLGVGFYILTQAQTGGYQSFFVETILGTNGAIQVTDRFQDTLEPMELGVDGKLLRVRQRQGKQYEEGVAYPGLLMDALSEFEAILGQSEVLESQIRVSSGFRRQIAALYGIRIEDHRLVSSIESQVVLGDSVSFEHDTLSVMISPRMAESLGVRLGEKITLESSDQVRSYRIAALVESGVSAIDKVRIYIDIGEARSLLGKPFGESTIQLSINDPIDAPWIAAQIESTLGHAAASWQEREQVWLGVFNALSVSAGISMSALIVLAGLGIYNSLSMQVVEKQREVAILRAMGYHRADITRVFLYQGLMVAVVGIAGGWIFGAATTWLVTQIPLRIRGIFSSDHFVVSWDSVDYLVGALIALIIAMLGSILPALRGSRIEPATVIRGN